MVVALQRRFRVNEHRLLPPLNGEKSPALIVAINREGTSDSSAFIFLYDL
jgi:hypothetical protein